MNNISHFALVKTVHCHLIMIVLSTLEKLLVHCLVLTHWIVYLVQIELQCFLFYNLSKLWVKSHDALPRPFPYGIAKYVRLDLVVENVPLVEANLEASDDSGWPELLAIPPDFVHFVTDIVPSRMDKENLASFIKLLIDHFSFFEQPHLQILHDESHELRILVVVKR